MKQKQGKILPEGASQHTTAGPYSPALIVRGDELVVISGQAALDKDGNVIGDTIEEQAKVTLDNCLKQLRTCGCNFSDVFKVNVYLSNLDEWERFNEVYKKVMPEPRPVRTAIQSGLLLTFKVEIEMWAIKKTIVSASE